MSWPDALPRKNCGETTIVAAAATQMNANDERLWWCTSWLKISRRRLELLDQIASLMSEAQRIQNQRPVRQCGSPARYSGHRPISQSRGSQILKLIRRIARLELCARISVK